MVTYGELSNSYLFIQMEKKIWQSNEIFEFDDCNLTSEN